jgi:predicted DNA repair protein MutK
VVALIVKADDIGVALTGGALSVTRALGRRLVLAMPAPLKV